MMQRRRSLRNNANAHRFPPYPARSILDRHGGAGLNFVAFVDFAHAAGADHLIDFVNARSGACRVPRRDKTDGTVL